MEGGRVVHCVSWTILFRIFGINFLLKDHTDKCFLNNILCSFLNSRFLSFTCPSPSRGEGELWMPSSFRCFFNLVLWPMLLLEWSLCKCFRHRGMPSEELLQSSQPEACVFLRENAVFESTAVSMKFYLQILVVSFSCCCLFQSKKKYCMLNDHFSLSTSIFHLSVSLIWFCDQCCC